ncbi:MAG TPA: 16S rRNA (cytosine(967)-C(5))-methyltransferase, partial [Bacillales bacterium]|nr:16S rRNA (cytosine(967)-C(5))-methyltransferase [Bacillales bacterium]
TVDKEENTNMINQFLAENSQFEGDPTFKDRMPEAVQPFITEFELQIFPQDFGSDGFYIAAFRKKV